MNYFVARNGQQYGPYSEETVREYLAAGSLVASDTAREENAQAWQTLGQLLHLAPAAPQTPTPPPPPPGPQIASPQGGVQPLSTAQIIPPDLHWAVVLVLGVTGIFPVIWAFVQASYARKVDHKSSAIACYIVGCIFWCLTTFMDFGIMASDNPDASVFGWLFLFGMVCWIAYLIGNFSIRASMLDYYNSVEPIQLRLSGAMTFFFGMLYLQYHMSRIAYWKRTGVLRA